jgi:hypothetical protein
LGSFDLFDSTNSRSCDGLNSLRVVLELGFAFGVPLAGELEVE